MKVEILGCHGGESLGARTTCLLIGTRIALDAGSLAQALPIERQVKVRSIVLSHSHVDHTSSLPFFIENVFGQAEGAIDIYGSAATIYAIRRHLFNNATWPDFTRIPNHLLPAVRFHELEDEVPVEIEGHVFTPIPVDHLVPTYGFLIEKDGVSALWSSDTGPTKRLWEIANRAAGLEAICVETSFDNSSQHIADLSLHLTPGTLAAELKKLDREVPVYLHHLKPACIEKIHREVAELENPALRMLEEGRIYEF